MALPCEAGEGGDPRRRPRGGWGQVCQDCDNDGVPAFKTCRTASANSRRR